MEVPMPPLPPVSKVIRTALRFDLGDGTPAITRFFTSYSGTAPTNTDLRTLDTAIGAGFNTNLKSLMDSGSALEEISSVDLSSASGAVDIFPDVIGGTRGSAVIGASSCLVSSYQIARRYRGGHPRGYWPFGIQTDLSDRNTWKGTFTTAALTGLNAFFAAVVAGGWGAAGTLTHVNVAYYQGFTVITNPITGRARNVPNLRGTPLVDTVLAITPRASVGSQRRRDAFVG
jgi:hypothetical protein